MDAILLPLPENCFCGRFLRREKRFFIAFSREDKLLWAHTNNSGSMLGLLRPGSPILVSPAENPARRLPYTLELVCLAGANDSSFFAGSPDNAWVGVNTLVPNRILRSAFAAKLLPFARGYTHFAAEVQCGDSRFDALLTGDSLPPLWVECKNVTLVEDGVASFPDAVTVRGQKHVRAMTELVATGARAAFFYCVQRTDASCFAPADYIDPVYAGLFYEALSLGVEVWPFVVPADPTGFRFSRQLPVLPEF
ncbi:MAG: DNA/RNA nuclease SfsA [Desulfovibrio sp.]|jgi:sugar fermentation stimulation protein A|nr:DNA/RNA nuclease SfsA [Desulfovibrio sp.]